MHEVPFLDMAARAAPTAPAVEAAVLAVLRTGRYIGGPPVARCEARIAALLGRAHGVGVPSGTAALSQILQALGIGLRPDDEVIVPAVTFFSTAGAVLRAGATPVLADVLPDRPLLDPDAARALLTRRTRLVLPVHLFGDMAPHPSDLGVPVVDDAAQAVGAAPPVGQGLAAAVSFYPTKILGAVGDGGMVVTDDPDLAQRVRDLGFHGMTEPHLHHRTAGHMGGNSRLDAVQAAAILAQVDDLPRRIAARRAIAARYDAVLDELALRRDPGSPVSIYTLRHPQREALAQRLRQRGVQTALYYPCDLSQQPALQGCPRGATPHAARFCAEALALPCHEGMPDAHIDHVVASLKECL